MGTLQKNNRKNGECLEKNVMTKTYRGYAKCLFQLNKVCTSERLLHALEIQISKSVQNSEIFSCLKMNS